MQPAALPFTRDVVLIGGGHTHALLLRQWGMDPLPGARLTLISPAPTAPYTGMLPGHIAGHYNRAALDIDLVRLARHAGARLILSRATGIDRAARCITLPDRPPVSYDLASLDIGITAAMPDLSGYSEHAVSAKPMDGYAQAWARYLRDLAEGRGQARVVVIGAGVAGAELAMAMAFRLRKDGFDTARVTIVEAGPAPLPNIGAPARRRLLRHLETLGVALLTSVRVARIDAGAVHLADGRSLPSGFTLGAAGPRPQDWLAGTGLHLTDGSVTVDPMLRSIADPAIFAVGDCAHMAQSPRPKAGVYAVRQAPFLHRNLRAALGAGRMRAYRPQRDYLKLVSTGDRSAVADKFGLPLDGRWLWWLKDRIDARFMHRLGDLGPMPPPPLPAHVADGVRDEIAGNKPLCGGCGAKMGSDALHMALSDLPAAERADLLTGPGDDAAVLRHGDGFQVLTTDHLRAFTEDPWLMARITASHAMGDIWAMGAAPQVALASITLPRMSAALQARTLREIMAAAADAFRAEGAEIAGGHTALGAEMTLGFTVTGLAEGRVIGKGGARPGDLLILTKPLGTGIVLAAEMARAAPAHAVAAAWDSMAQPQGSAARLLSEAAQAMTDVTGFGLAGHLMEMMEASGTAARIDLCAVPFLPGAVELSAAGHASTLADANRIAVAARVMMTPVDPVGNARPCASTGSAGPPPRAGASLPPAVGRHPSFPGQSNGCSMAGREDSVAALLFDPQTAGGLLAAVAPDRATDLLASLHDAGFGSAAIIGEVETGTPQLRLEAHRHG